MSRKNAKDQLEDSAQYLERKAYFDTLLTVYGRQTCLEVLRDKRLSIHKLHLADSNKSAKIIDDLLLAANEREIEIVYHSKKELSRISKNGRQDQGVALDLKPEGFNSFDKIADVYKTNSKIKRGQQTANEKVSSRILIAIDRITNPNNLGMLIRSVTAAPNAALLYDSKGCAPLDAMVIKASAGTLFRAPLFTGPLLKQLAFCKDLGYPIIVLDSHAEQSINEINHRAEGDSTGTIVYVLGNETNGVSQQVRALSNGSARIPMSNHVESLNVAIAGSLLAFSSVI